MSVTTQDIKVRIAPSPTGSLHIGTARAALFNYLFAKKHGGKFYLRIEDTDESRNSSESYNSITDGLSWLGLSWDGEIVYQSKRKEFYQKQVQKLLDSGAAYYSYITKEDMESRHAASQASGGNYIHRYSPNDEVPIDGVEPAIRLRVKSGVDIINHDLIQGDVVINSDTVEDFVIMRGDGTPLYVTSVVCDDIDMQITHVLRGVDHLTNTAKQILLYEAFNAKIPNFGHIPLVYGDDGKKLSKRHGATSAAEYRSLGYIPSAMRSYLLRLGFSTDTDDILSDSDALRVFNISGIGKSPSQFDFAKLKSVNHHFLTILTEHEVCDMIKKDFSEYLFNISDELLLKIIEITKHRYSTFLELAESVKYFVHSGKIINQGHADLFVEFLDGSDDTQDLNLQFKAFLATRNIKFGEVGQSIRSSLAGDGCQIGIFELLKIFGTSVAKSRILNADI